MIQTLEEQSFANLYNTVYANVSMLPFEINALDVKDGKAVNYLNAATRYATNASKCEIIGKTAHFSYLQETDMQTLLSTLERYEIFKNDTKLSSFFMGVNNAFTLAKNRYVGELGVFGGKTYTLSLELPDTVLSSLDPHANALSIALRERKYQLTDGENELTFLLENTRLVLIDGAIEHTKNLTFSYLPNARAYAVMINGDCTDQELTIPMRRLLLPVVQMNASGDFLPTLSLEKLTLPYTIQTIKANAFSHFSALERVDFLGTADQWAEIDFENEGSSPTRLSKNLYPRHDFNVRHFAIRNQNPTLCLYELSVA